MKVHHVGYAVFDVEKSLESFRTLGYRQTSEIVFDEIRGVNIVFMRNDEETIELVAPSRENSDVGCIVKKSGAVPYHVCYEAENIEDTVKELKKSGWFPVKKPEIAPAIDNRRVVFLYSKDAGLIELVERAKSIREDFFGTV